MDRQISAVGAMCDLRDLRDLAFFLSLSQADATHERVVKREDGERLAKVNHKLHT